MLVILKWLSLGSRLNRVIAFTTRWSRTASLLRPWRVDREPVDREALRRPLVEVGEFLEAGRRLAEADERFGSERRGEVAPLGGQGRRHAGERHGGVVDLLRR